MSDWKAMPGEKELGHMISSKPASGHLDHSNRPMLHQFRRLDPSENASDNTASPNRAEFSCNDQSVRYTLLKNNRNFIVNELCLHALINES